MYSLILFDLRRHDDVVTDVTRQINSAILAEKKRRPLRGLSSPSPVRAVILGRYCYDIASASSVTMAVRTRVHGTLAVIVIVTPT